MGVTCPAASMTRHSSTVCTGCTTAASYTCIGARKPRLLSESTAAVAVLQSTLSCLVCERAWPMNISHTIYTQDSMLHFTVYHFGMDHTSVLVIYTTIRHRQHPHIPGYHLHLQSVMSTPLWQFQQQHCLLFHNILLPLPDHLDTQLLLKHCLYYISIQSLCARVCR